MKDVYDKVQIKKVPTSEQRIAQGKVNGVAWTTGQIKSITAFVQRTPEAAEKANDTVGWYCEFFKLFSHIKTWHIIQCYISGKKILNVLVIRKRLGIKLNLQKYFDGWKKANTSYLNLLKFAFLH